MFSRIDFIDRSPFNNVQVGDTLKIDLDRVGSSNSSNKFSARNVAERGNFSLGNATKGEEIIGKTVVGGVVTGFNIACPELGNFMADGLQTIGFGAEFVGNLTGNKEIEKAGEILQSGAGMGSSVSKAMNIGEGHVKSSCMTMTCNNEEIDKTIRKCTGAVSGTMEVIKEITSIEAVKEFLKP
jgi:hypothetical protein